MTSWSKAIQECLGQSEKVPKGWQTTRDIALEIGKSIRITRERLVGLITQGKAERKMFRVLSGGVVRPIPHYRLK